MGFSPQDIEGMLDELEKSRLIAPLSANPAHFLPIPGEGQPALAALKSIPGVQSQGVQSQPQPQPASAVLKSSVVPAQPEPPPGPSSATPEKRSPPPPDEFSEFAGMELKRGSLPKGAQNVKHYEVVRDPSTNRISKITEYTLAESQEDQTDGA